LDILASPTGASSLFADQGPSVLRYKASRSSGYVGMSMLGQFSFPIDFELFEANANDVGNLFFSVRLFDYVAGSLALTASRWLSDAFRSVITIPYSGHDH
jgi:hypothetical protein